MTWEIVSDPAVWVQVPYFDDAGDARDWVERATSAVSNDFASEFTLPDGYRDLLATQLGILANTAHESSPTYGNLLAHLPGPDWLPFPVFVAFREPQQESPDYLLDVAGARGLPSVQPPSVEHIVVDDLGEGIRVLRYEDDPDLGLVASLCYAWRAHDTDVFVFAQTNDLARLEQIHPDLVALASSIRPVSDGAASDG